MSMSRSIRVSVGMSASVRANANARRSSFPQISLSGTHRLSSDLGNAGQCNAPSTRSRPCAPNHLTTQSSRDNRLDGRSTRKTGDRKSRLCDLIPLSRICVKGISHVREDGLEEQPTCHRAPLPDILPIGSFAAKVTCLLAFFLQSSFFDRVFPAGVVLFSSKPRRCYKSLRNSEKFSCAT